MVMTTVGYADRVLGLPMTPGVDLTVASALVSHSLLVLVIFGADMQSNMGYWAS